MTPPPTDASGSDGWGDPSKFLLAIFLWVSAMLGTWQECEAKRDRQESKRDRQRVEEQLREIKALIEARK